MAATPYVTRFPIGKLPDCTPASPCQPAPVCPACGGLECLCRPRFFAGQLLTEHDLNRLDDYIVAKNRLHNRYLVGWGVACGLEVVCSVCDPAGSKGTVIVKSGYALSPCGNDIIVCGDTSVNICDLIARCRPADDMCLGATATIAADESCSGGTEEWILGICYREQPSRGVTALLNATPSACSCGGSKCGCGGARTAQSGCACGGGKKAGSSTQTSAPQRECEPTLTCEGYTFAVWRAPKPQKNARTWGAAAKRFICCIEPFLSALGRYPKDMPAEELASWYFDLREAVREFLVSEGLYDCTIAAKLASATMPSTGESNDTKLSTNVLQATYAVLAVASLVIQKCFCASLLPSCPDMAETDCVPIATITVNRRPCEVTNICNIAARKFLVTIPNIQYWLSFFSAFEGHGVGGFNSLGELLERLCCTDLERWVRQYLRAQGNVFTGFTPQARERTASDAVEAETTSSPFGTILQQALANPGRTVNAATLMLGAMGAVDREGQPLASDFELAHPADFLLANQVVAPALGALLPSLGPLAGLFGGPAAPAAETNVKDLSSEISTLKETVAQQQRELDRLKKSRRR